MKPCTLNFCISANIYIISPAVKERAESFCLEVDMFDLQKVVDSNNDIILSVKMAITEYFLHLEKDVVVCRVVPDQVLDEYSSAFLGHCKANVHFFSQCLI